MLNFREVKCLAQGHIETMAKLGSKQVLRTPRLTLLAYKHLKDSFALGLSIASPKHKNNFYKKKNENMQLATGGLFYQNIIESFCGFLFHIQEWNYIT